MASDEDPYVYEGTDVLRNNFNERDGDVLADIERVRTAAAMRDLQLNPVEGNFDAQHLLKIHERIFEEVYPFAGEPREITLTKIEISLRGEEVEYAKPDQIMPQLDSATAALREFRWDDTDPRGSSTEFAEGVTAVWKAHAFREGNTRAVSIFMNQLATERGFELDNNVLSRYPSEFRDALTLGAFRERYGAFAELIESARAAQLGREHPTIGRLSSEAAEALGFMGDPDVRRLGVDEAARGQVFANSYNTVIVRTAREFVAVDVERFPTPPNNNDRVSVEPKVEKRGEAQTAHDRLKEYISDVNTARPPASMSREGLRQVAALSAGEFDPKNITQARLFNVAKEGVTDDAVAHVLRDGTDPVAKAQIGAAIAAIEAGKAADVLKASDVRTLPEGTSVSGTVLANSQSVAVVRDDKNTIFVADRLALSNADAKKGDQVQFQATPEATNAQLAKLFTEISPEEASKNVRLEGAHGALRKFDNDMKGVPDGASKDAARGIAVNAIADGIAKGGPIEKVDLEPAKEKAKEPEVAKAPPQQGMSM